MSTSQIAVIGIGDVGAWTCRALGEQGYDVLGIDASSQRVQDLVDDLPGYVRLVAADATERGALDELQLDRVDSAVVTIGTNVEASVLASMNLIELGVPHVVARASNEVHGRVLRRIGVQEVFMPSRQAGRTLARMAASRWVVDYLELEGGESLVESEVPDAWRDRTLADLGLTADGLTVLVHKRGKESGTLPHGDQVLAAGDRIVVGGADRVLRASELFVTPTRA